MILVKATKDSEAGAMPEEELFEEMADYHEELAKEGSLVDASGLQPSSKGWRIKYSGKNRTFVDGPFAETKELVAGYTLIEAKSKEEAIEWTKRFPNPAGNGRPAEIEVRQLFELDDFEPSQAIERFRKMETGAKQQPERKGVRPIPEGMHTIAPHLICAGAADAIEFYKKGFDAVEVSRLEWPGGKIMHAMLRIGDSIVMLTDEFPDMGALGPGSLGGSPVTIHLYVEDVDAFVARAVDAGAKITLPVEDRFWGDRYGQIEDPLGHRWSVATHIRDLSPEEIREGAKHVCA